MGFLLVMLEELERLLEVKVVIETLPQCIIKTMAVKDDTVHLVDEASYSGNFKEKTRHCNPCTGALEGQSVTHYSTDIPAQKATWSNKEGKDYWALSLMGPIPTLRTKGCSQMIWGTSKALHNGATNVTRLTLWAAALTAEEQDFV